MSRSHPSWPSPLLALDPIRLRPMGWLDDLLPMRPPSLWRDRSLYARALRWQPDMADLSWLFDAYAMLGIEMPAPRIEHRSHQRSPQRGRLKGGATQQHIRRRRAPIKGANRPLAIPRWSSPPQMVAPRKGDTQERVDSTPAFKARRQVAPSSLPQFQWRSPDRSAPPPNFSRPTQGQAAPSLGTPPTLLRKDTASDSNDQASQASLENRSQSKRTPVEDAKQSKGPQTKKNLTAPEPLVSRTQQSPAQIASPTVLRRSLPETVAEPRKSTPSGIEHLDVARSSKPRTESDTVESKTKRTFSTGPSKTVRQLLRQIQQVEWSPRQKGIVQTPVWEQKRRRSTVSPVEMTPTPISTNLTQENVVVPSSSKKTETVQVVEGRTKPVAKSTAVDAKVVERSTEPSIVEPRTPRDTSTAQTEQQKSRRSDSTVESEQRSVQAKTAVDVQTPKSVTAKQRTDTTPLANRATTAQVRVPTRVPWRLNPSQQQLTFRGNKTVLQVSMEGTTDAPLPEQVIESSKPSRIPRVRSWFRPERTRLIQHFQQRALSQRKKQTFSAEERPSIAPIYAFSSAPTNQEKRFRATEQTMVAPLRAGTLVFPTPPLEAENRQMPTVQSDAKDASKKSVGAPNIEVSKPKAMEKTPSSVGSEQKGKSRYAEPFVQTTTGYRRRSVSTMSTWRLLKSQSRNANKTASTLSEAIRLQSVQERWRLPVVSIRQGNPSSSPQTTTLSQPQLDARRAKTFRSPSSFWQGAFANTGTVQLQSQLVYTTLAPLDDSSKKKRSTSVVEERTERAPQTSASPSPTQSVSWKRKPKFADPFLAHRRTVLSAQSAPTQLGKNVASEGFQETQPGKQTASKSAIEESAQTVGTPTVDARERRAKRLTPSLSGASTVSGRSASTSNRGGDTIPVRRVVAPTLSPSLVFNFGASGTSESTAQGVGKYGRGSEQSKVSPQSSTVIRDDRLTKSVGKYGPSSNATTSIKKIDELQEGVQSTETVSQLESPQETQASSDLPTESIVEETIRKQLRQLVRRLPQNQQSLLRSRLSLPTKWARKLGIAPTTEVRLGWNPQRTENARSIDPVQRVTPTAQQQQLVVPKIDGNPQTTVSTQTKYVEQSTVQATPATSERSTQSIKSSPPRRKLTTAQVNQIIERQVSFFRSAQRQSFLRVSQMTDSSVVAPSPARSGLQQVTGEMRKALQQMVFSSEARPVFLEATSESLVDGSTVAIGQTASSKTTSNRTGVAAPRRRLQQRTPQWRPGVHTPAPSRKSKSQRNQISSSPSAPRPAIAQTTPTSDFVSKISDPDRTSTTNISQSSVVSAQRTESSRTVSTPMVPAEVAQNMTNLQATVPNEQPRERPSVQLEENTTQRKQRSSTPVPTTRLSPSKRRSAPMAPRTLMGRSDVGVFLKPKKSTVAEEVQEPTPKVETPKSMDSASDVFMVDASGNLLTGQAATKKLTELGFARARKKPQPKPSSSSSGSYTWEAPTEMMEQALEQMKKEMVVESEVKEQTKSKATPVRQSVIKEWTEEQLLSILVELAGSSPEASALLRDVQERVEEYFDLERFRKI